MGRDIHARIRAAAGQGRSDGQTYLNLIHRDDVATALALLLNSDHEGVLNLCDDHPETRQAFYDQSPVEGIDTSHRWLGYAQSYTLASYLINDEQGRAHLRGYIRKLSEAKTLKDVRRITRATFTDKLLKAMIKPWLGDSMARWEDNSLVVRTTQFHPQHDLRGSTRHLFYMSEDSVVEERFTRVNQHEILYQFTVTDDDIYSQPWSGELTLRSSEEQIYEYACHEGNYALPNILAGARKEEQE